MEQLDHVADVYLAPLGMRILIALAIFYFGRLIARQLAIALDRVMESTRIDASLRKFLRDVAYAIMIAAVVIAALDALGVETTAVIAVLGAAGLAIGLALQGSLSNFAAGVMLIVLRPYKVGDVVTIGKYAGRVEAIRVFHTLLVTADNREITIPNAQVIAQPIENHTVLGRRRVDLVVTLNEAAELGRVKELLEQVVLADERVLAAPPPAIDVAEISDASVKLTLRPWTTSPDHGAVAASAMERLRDALAAAGLKFTVTAPPAA